MKIYRSKYCVEKFVEHIQDEVKRLYATFSQQSMAELTDTLKIEHKVAEKKHTYFKEFNASGNKKVRDHCNYSGSNSETAHSSCNVTYQMQGHIFIVFHNVSCYDTHLFIKELGKKFDKDGIGVISEGM